MSKIPVGELIRLFRIMNNEHWSYEWGAASKGTVDCSGAFVWAFKQFSRSIYHGSNRIQRTECGLLLPVSQAKPGMAAFKKRNPGQNYYALPAGYQAGGAFYNGDLSDYYHIGLVDEDPGYVLNAQSTRTGFQRSPITENWHGVAYLNQVAYGEDQEEGDKMTYTVTGGALRLRKGPGTDYDVILSIPSGMQVEGISVSGEWMKVRYGGQEGWCMAAYLVAADEENLPEKDLVTLDRDAWEALAAAFEKVKATQR